MYLHVNRTERPMKIEIVVDPARPAPPASLASRVAPPPSAIATPEARGARSVHKVGLDCFFLPIHRPAARGARRGRGRGRKSNERPQKSVADLDAEMEVCLRISFLDHHVDVDFSGLHRDQCSCSCCRLKSDLCYVYLLMLITCVLSSDTVPIYVRLW